MHEGAKLCDLTLKSSLGFLPGEEIEEFLPFVAMPWEEAGVEMNSEPKHCLQ